MSQAPKSLVDRILSILDVVANGAPVVSRAHIASRTGLPKATTNRIVADLVAARLLQPLDGGLGLGIRLCELGALTEPFVPALEATSLPYLQDLYEITRGTVHLAVLDGMDVFYLQKISGRRSVRLDTRAGGRQPLTCTGSGKLLLAFAPPVLLDQVIRERGFVRRTPHSITDRQAFVKELARIRSQRYSVDNEEFTLGTRCIAGPIFRRDQVVAVVSLSESIGRTATAAAAQAVRATTAAISRELTREPSRPH